METDYFIQVSTKLLRGRALRKLKGSVLHTFMAIIGYVGRDGKCFPSQITISENSGYSIPQTKRDIGKLIRMGLIEKTRQGGWHRGSNVYRVRGFAKFGHTPEPLELAEKECQGITHDTLTKGSPMIP